MFICMTSKIFIYFLGYTFMKKMDIRQSKVRTLRYAAILHFSSLFMNISFLETPPKYTYANGV